MDLKAALDIYKLPKKLAHELINLGFPEPPNNLTDQQLDRIEGMYMLWGKETFLRMQLSKMSTKRALLLVVTRKMNKIERFMLVRIIRAKINGEEVHSAQLAAEAIYFLGIEDSEATRKKLNVLANKMKQRSHHYKNKLIAIYGDNISNHLSTDKDIANALGIQLPDECLLK